MGAGTSMPDPFTGFPDMPSARPFLVVSDYAIYLLSHAASTTWGRLRFDALDLFCYWA